ncbi:replication protein RepA [Roseibium aestuarii]|uniref:Replication protein RepA n=1 Tax=Roseibium aestuarii TaxID=2600299 RepID=A0ABW4K062_9HYPH|nr:replication protein RepA [Roseibium aestuarii]
MNSPKPFDDSKIRDADLREELERLRGGPMFTTLAQTLISRQERRDQERAVAEAKARELDAMPREQRRRAIVRQQFEDEPPTVGDLRHIHSVLAVCGLPYERQPLDVRRYERRQGSMSLLVNAGEIMTPSGKWAPQELPFGPKARLILMHLCSQAVLQNSPTIEIAETFTAFVREMGFNDSGGSRGALTAFKQQLNALAACELKIGTWNGTTAKTKSFKPIDEFEVWLSNNPGQRSLWPSTLTFSQDMYESLKHHAMPVNVRAVKAFAGSARKLDLYFWLGYRLHLIDKPLHISWKALAEQFGTGFSRQRDFQRKLAEELGHIEEVFPKLPIKLTEDGLNLRPADPNVLALPAQKVSKKKTPSQK